MIYFVYALTSVRHSRIYVGFSNNPEARLNQHNSGLTKSTRHYRPWEMLFFEKAGSRVYARKLEKYFKSGIGREFLDSLKN